MTKLVSLELDYTIKVSSRINNYLSPDYVFFPLDKGSQLLVKDKEAVLKGKCLLKKSNSTIFSTVSGRIAGVKKIVCDGEVKHYLVVENDYKEKSRAKSTKKSLKIKNKEALLVLLNEFGITIDFLEKDVLLLNAIDNEPYIVNNSMYLNKNINNVLETLDVLKSILGHKSVYILLKNTETEVLNKVNDLLGTYPDFKIIMVPNCYLIERKEFYKNYLDVSLDNIFEISMSDFYNVSEIIEKNKPLTEKYITISGDGVKNPLVINAKIGSLLKNIVEEEIELVKPLNDLNCYYNGLMKGKITSLDSIVVDDSFDGIIISQKKECEEEQCINCGLCMKHCPLNISPIENLLNKEDINCLNCGLCSYVCPSRINFKKITKKVDANE